MSEVQRTQLDADQKAAAYAGYVEQYLLERGVSECSMTDATEAIWGSSGRGNPNAVRIIEAVATLGYLKIYKIGKRRRIVTRTNKVIPTLCYEYAGIAPPE